LELQSKHDYDPWINQEGSFVVYLSSIIKTHPALGPTTCVPITACRDGLPSIQSFFQASITFVITVAPIHAILFKIIVSLVKSKAWPDSIILAVIWYTPVSVPTRIIDLVEAIVHGLAPFRVPCKVCHGSIARICTTDRWAGIVVPRAFAVGAKTIASGRSSMSDRQQSVEAENKVYIEMHLVRCQERMACGV